MEIYILPNKDFKITVLRKFMNIKKMHINNFIQPRNNM
jgi:hypothetical protein